MIKKAARAAFFMRYNAHQNTANAVWRTLAMPGTFTEKKNETHPTKYRRIKPACSILQEIKLH